MDDSIADAFVSVCVGKFIALSVSWGVRSESKTCVQLNLTPRTDSTEDPADVTGEIARCVFEHGVSIPSQSERALRVAWDCKIWTIQALPLMKEGGSVIVTGSGVWQKGIPMYPTYGATKAALRSFVRTWTAELAGKGIRANVIAPARSRRLFSTVNLARIRML